jgi:hypothetical protein
MVLNNRFRRLLVLALYCVYAYSLVDSYVSNSATARVALGRSDDEQYWQVTESTTTSSYSFFIQLLSPSIIIVAMVATCAVSLKRGYQSDTRELSSFVKHLLSNFGLSKTAASQPNSTTRIR